MVSSTQLVTFNNQYGIIYTHHVGMLVYTPHDPIFIIVAINGCTYVHNNVKIKIHVLIRYLHTYYEGMTIYTLQHSNI